MISVIWLDTLAHSDENRLSQEKLRLSINDLKVFDDHHLCERHIQSLLGSHQLILIIGDNFCQELLPKFLLHDQIGSVYIHSEDRKASRVWIDRSVKVKGVHNQMDELIDQICQNRFRRMQNMTLEPLSLSITGKNINIDQTTTGLNGQFIHSQLLIECLRQMESTTTDRDELIKHCLEEYRQNKYQREQIEQFQKNYDSQESLWWYTKETFLYRLLNRSLRQQDIDRLFQLRFVIRDIEQQLKENCCSTSIVVYRGQIMSKRELEYLRTSIGQLISVNSFLSTTLDRNLALQYLQPVEKLPNEYQSVLFEIEADPSQQHTYPFADISMHSQFPQEQEVLMMLGSVFRLERIFLNKDYQWVIKLTLCGDNDHDLKAIFNHQKNQYDSAHNRLLLFGHVLVDMGAFDEAEKYYSRLVEQLSSEDRDRSNCYHALGKVACEKGNYDQSLQWFFKSLETVQHKLRENHSKIGFIYTSIGETYQKSGDLKKALAVYEKALHIWTTNKQEEFIAWCHNNIGTIYDEDGQYDRALEYLLKALETKERILPAQHACLGNSYLNIGNIYFHLKDYDCALENYQKAKNVYRQSLTPKHPSIACAMKNIGIIHEVRGEYSSALKQYQNAFTVRQRTFDLSHPDTVLLERDIQRVSSKIKSSKIEK